MTDTKIDLTLPIFEHRNKIFHNYKYKLINIYIIILQIIQKIVYTLYLLMMKMLSMTMIIHVWFMVGALKEMVLKLNSGRI